MSGAMPSARLDLRARPSEKALIERAAAIAGQSVSEFVKATMVAKSREILAQHEKQVLSDRDRDAFLALLDAPAEPVAALRLAAEDFNRAVLDGSLKR